MSVRTDNAYNAFVRMQGKVGPLQGTRVLHFENTAETLGLLYHEITDIRQAMYELSVGLANLATAIAEMESRQAGHRR